MTIRIKPLLEQDISIKVRLEFEAFKNHPRIPILWPRGYTPELYSFKESGDKTDLSDSDNHFWKAVDSATGDTIATADWTFHLDTSKDGESKGTAEDAPPPADWPEGGNWEIRRWYKRNFERMVREYLGGKAYITLNLLTVLPEHQGRGAGRQLLQWGIEEADRLHVQMCLESTPAGKALYEKNGFKVVEVVSADMRQFGWSQPYDEEGSVRIFMIREAR